MQNGPIDCGSTTPPNVSGVSRHNPPPPPAARGPPVASAAVVFDVEADRARAITDSCSQKNDRYADRYLLVVVLHQRLSHGKIKVCWRDISLLAFETVAEGLGFLN